MVASLKSLKPDKPPWNIFCASRFRQLFEGLFVLFAGRTQKGERRVKIVDIDDYLDVTRSFPDNEWRKLRLIYTRKRYDETSLVLIIFAELVSVAICLAFANFTVNSSRNDPAAIALVIGYVFIIFFGIWVIISRYRQDTRDKLAAELLELAATIEMNPAWWRSILSQRALGRRIERCARLFERLPLGYGSHHVGVAEAVVGGRARSVAQHFREYSVWVAFPGPFTYTDLQHKVVQALRLVSEDRWYELPVSEAPINIRANRFGRVMLSLVVVVLFAGLLVLAVFQGKLGLSGTLASTVLSIIIVLLLARLGLSISTLQQAADAAKAAGGASSKKE